MISKLLKCGALFWTLFSTMAHADSAPNVVGEARHPDTANILYEEHHYCTEALQLCTVSYLEYDGELLASKRVDYRFNKQAPDVIFKDIRRDQEFSASEAGRVDIVIDAGFDNFVRLHWNKLESGKSVQFPFQLMDRDKPLNMKVSEAADGNCNSRDLCLQVRLDSWLLAALIDPIRLTYDRQQRRLLRFQGLSNIRDSNGGRQQVDIHYSYNSAKP